MVIINYRESLKEQERFSLILRHATDRPTATLLLEYNEAF